MKKNIITTVMPVFNGERYITQALSSLASQVPRPDTVIILDNCSTDRTREIVTGFNGLTCEYRQNERNLGLFGNHNRALSFAQETEFLHILHYDDILKPDFYSRAFILLRETVGRGMAWCQADLIDEHGQMLQPILKTTQGSPEEVTLDNFLKERSSLRANIFVSGVMLKTDHKPAPCRFREDLKQIGDQYFWAEWACHCERRIRIREVLLSNRAHASSATMLNQNDMKTLVLDDWTVIEEVEAMRHATGFRQWLRMQKLKCFFAALTHVKMQLVQNRSPEFAHRLTMAGKGIVPLPHWVLGKSAFYLREFFRSLTRSKPGFSHD